jgi:predicted RNase H-like HicB family nuclease
MRYPVTVFWSDEDEGFIATAPDLPGSSAFGESQTEALAQLEHAIKAWIEAAKAAGNPVPEPSRPSVEAQPSGKILLRMPKSLHAELARSAKHENVSLNHYVVFLLTHALTYRASTRDFARSYWVTGTMFGAEPLARGNLHVISQYPPTTIGTSFRPMIGNKVIEEGVGG